jgi:transposase-like protein
MDLIKLFEMFPDDASAERKFAEMRWPDAEPACPHCGSLNVQTGAQHRTMPYRCRDCRKRFSVRTGTVMEASNIGYQKWAIAIYVLTTSNKGVSSRRLAAMLGITQKSAWHLAHRIREGWALNQLEVFDGPVEVDETWVGGRDRNRHRDKRLRQHWRRGRVPVVGLRDRATGRLAARVVPHTGASELQPFVMEHTGSDTIVFTDEWHSYRGLSRRRRSVNHSVGQYVDGDAHTNGIESFWAIIKRSYVGTYHHLGGKHLHRYVAEFVGRQNARARPVEQRMRDIVQGFTGRLRYADLTA